MDTVSLTYLWILIIFVLGYTAIILEHNLKIHKTGVALVVGVLCWAVYFLFSTNPLKIDLDHLSHHVSDIAQIIFFLIGAMAMVEMIDSHRGFKIITDFIQTRSKMKMLWLIAFVTFFLSAVLDNLTTTILMISLLRKLIPHHKDRILLACVVVIAANAGGAWSPIGDVTTTMLWINGQITAMPVIKALVLPSLVCLLIPVAMYSYAMRGKFEALRIPTADAHPEPGARLVFYVGILGLVSVPVFKALTGLPPFMGVMIALGVLWLVTDVLHYKEEARQHLTLPHILTKIDTSSILFFLGILLTVAALQTAGILTDLALWLDRTVHNYALIATFIGLFSAVVDNVPLVAATMGMYPIETYPPDHTLWHMIAYAAGTGGSILIIGSSSGVAMMGMEKVDFVTYLKVAGLPALLGFLGGMGLYLLFF